jgi:hypothetical protein
MTPGQVKFFHVHSSRIFDRDLLGEGGEHMRGLILTSVKENLDDW